MENEILEYEEIISKEVKRKPVRISAALIAKRNLPQSLPKGSQDEDEWITALMKLTHLRLDREFIAKIDNLEMMGSSITNVYLQHNCITKIENLESLISLRFLTLSNNQISKLENLTELKNLCFLDLSDNQIMELNTAELPTGLIIFNLKGNPCTNIEGYRYMTLKALATLKQLDERQVTREDRLIAGCPLSSSSNEEEDSDTDQKLEELRTTPIHEMNTLDDVFRLSTQMIKNSQSRKKQNAKVHKEHMNELEAHIHSKELQRGSISGRSSASSSISTSLFNDN